MLTGRYTGMETIKCVICDKIVCPKGHMNLSTFIQRTGNKYTAREKISARKEFLHRAEISISMPVRRMAPEIPRNVMYRKNPRTFSGQ